MVLSLNFNHLYYFYVIGKAQGVSEAARLLNISQPSLSSQMKVLEAKLGVPLFSKAGRRLTMTAHGLRVFAACEKMFAVAEGLDRNLEFESRGHQVAVHLGVSSDVERPFAVDVLSRLIAKEKRIKVRFLSGSETWLQKELEFGNFDFVLTTRPVFSERTRVLAEHDLPVMAGIAKNLLKPGGRPKSLKDLPDRWISPAPHQKLRKETEAFFERKKISPQSAFESDVMGALIRAIADGIGWGLFPKPYLRHENLARNILLLGPAEGFWRHRIYLLASRRSRPLESFEKALVAALASECRP